MKMWVVVGGCGYLINFCKKNALKYIPGHLSDLIIGLY